MLLAPQSLSRGAFLLYHFKVEVLARYCATITKSYATAMKLKLRWAPALPPQNWDAKRRFHTIAELIRAHLLQALLIAVRGFALPLLPEHVEMLTATACTQLLKPNDCRRRLWRCDDGLFSSATISCKRRLWCRVDLGDDDSYSSALIDCRWRLRYRDDDSY